MDLKGLENTQWRGFSDREIQQLHTKIKNTPNAGGSEVPVEVKVVSKPPRIVDAPKLDEEEKKEIDTRKQVGKERQNELETEQDPDSTLTVGEPLLHELDPEKQQARTAELHLKQKLMEEENKRRQALIEQTLQDRARQHQLETKMLISVKMGLGDLEKVVSKDVKILRDKIEQTDKLYNSAKKRFEHAEAEYIAAKMELFKWSEQKELLSEHLCAVIQQNESRKAAKLDDLLKSLEIKDTVQQNTNS